MSSAVLYLVSRLSSGCKLPRILSASSLPCRFRRWSTKDANEVITILRIQSCSSYALIAMIVLIVANPKTSLAANHYVWCGGANNGDGSTLQSARSVGGVGAYADLPASLTRGDTYYTAGDPTCTYPPH